MEVNKEKWNSKDTVVTRDKAIRHTHTHTHTFQKPGFAVLTKL